LDNLAVEVRVIEDAFHHPEWELDIAGRLCPLMQDQPLCARSVRLLVFAGSARLPHRNSLTISGGENNTNRPLKQRFLSAE
jgi:hypothetical protein